MVAEYAASFGGPPAPDTPWHLFLMLVETTPRFHAREVLWIAKGTEAGFIAAQGGGGLRQALERKELQDTAFPWGADGEPVTYALKQSRDGEDR